MNSPVSNRSDRARILAALDGWLGSPDRLRHPVIRILEGKRPEGESPSFFLEYPRLIIVLKGRGIFRTIEHKREECVTVVPGQILLLAEGTWICPTPRVSYESLGIILRTDSTRLTIHSRKIVRGTLAVSSRYIAQWRTQETLGERGACLLTLLKQPPAERLGEHSVSVLAEILVAELATLVTRATEYPRSLQPIHWQAVCDYISEHWSDPALSRDMVARFFHRHPNYFSRLFQTHAKCNFRSYINELRLQRSLVLLRDVRCNVTDVAAFCGFTHLQYFICCFRKRFGLSPGQYQKRYDN